MVSSLHILIILSIFNSYFTQRLFEKFVPGARKRFGHHFHSRVISQNYNPIPLYLKPGPNPLNDYMSYSFKPRKLVKRYHRIKRQIKQEDSYFQDLLDSFGGDMKSNQENSAEAITDKEISEENIETPKTGFYFLLDWNSFFTLDDQNGRRVNIKIEPKLGDPKRFFSVTVP